MLEQEHVGLAQEAVVRGKNIVAAIGLYGGFAIVGGVSRVLVSHLGGKVKEESFWREIGINAFVAMPIGVLAGWVAQYMSPNFDALHYAAAYAFGTGAGNIVRWLDSEGIKVLEDYLKRKMK